VAEICVAAPGVFDVNGLFGVWIVDAVAVGDGFVLAVAAGRARRKIARPVVVDGSGRL